MKLSTYQHVTDSHVPWLGQIPSHWHVTRLKWSVAGCWNGVWGDEPDEVNDVVCVRVADFDRDKLTVSSSGLTLRAVERDQFESRKLRRGDLLIEKSGGGEKQLVGCVVHFDHEFDAVCSNFVARMPVVKDLDAKYWCYTHAALYAGRLNYPAIKQTTGIQNLDASEYFNTLVAYPPVPEQRQIAAFLDWKTGQIDALIARKKALLEKLKEKRTAVITQAVTKGLNPAAPMRDSGIPWLGQVPEHWEVKRLRRFVSRIEQGWSPQCDNSVAMPDEWGVVKAGCCNGGRFDPDENKALPSDNDAPENLEIKSGDLLMSRASGSEELIGSAALVPPGVREKLLLSDKIYRLQCDDAAAIPAFVALAIQSPVGRYQIQAVISGAFGLARNIAQSDVKDLMFAVPPISEQFAIVSYLNCEIDQLNRMAVKVESAIDRLFEYRAALITAATTGKIDVRNVAVPA